MTELKQFPTDFPIALDNAAWMQAKSEMPDASLSAIAQRAQQIKLAMQENTNA